MKVNIAKNTGKQRTCYGKAAPLVLGTPSVGSDFAERVQLADGRIGLVFNDGGNDGIYDGAVAVDSGDNVVAEVSADASLSGIAAGPSLTVVGRNLIAWLQRG